MKKRFSSDVIDGRLRFIKYDYDAFQFMLCNHWFEMSISLGINS